MNQNGYADPETRQRVLLAARQLHYKPNAHWSRLRARSSRTILFLLCNHPHFNSFHTRLLGACEKTLRGCGYDLIFARHEYPAELRPADIPLPAMLDREGAVDGLLLAGVHHANFLAALRKRQLPYTVLGNNFAVLPEQNCISFNDEAAVEDATRYLIRLEHRRIAFLGNGALPWFRKRYTGYRRVMEEHYLPLLEATADWQVSNIDYGQLAVGELLRTSPHPTALVAGNDEIAAGAWKELTRRRIPIPARMSLLGIGDRPEFSILEPALSSIAVFPESLGDRMTTLLLEQIRNPRRPVASELFPCKLVERASCAPPPEEFKLHTLKRNT